jgi:antitoxin VapB
LPQRQVENPTSKGYVVVESKLSLDMLTLPPETEKLARQVAQRSGKSPEDVLRQAVEAQARMAGVAIAETVKPLGAFDLPRIREIVRRVADKPLRDTRTPKDIRDQAWGEPG